MCHYTIFGMASTNLPTFLNMSLPVRHSPPGHQPSCSRICSFLCSLIHTSSSSTSSIQGKEALCAHKCITISHKNGHNSSTMPCLGSPREALFLLSNLLEFALTRCADRHLPTCEPGLDMLPMFRTDGQKTIRAACPCLVVARITGQWVPCCALTVHRCSSRLTSLSLRSAATYNFTEV